MPARASTGGILSGVPSICTGNGGKASHLREFAVLIDKVGDRLQQILRLDAPWPRKKESTQDLEVVMAEVHGWCGCPHCHDDHRSLGLLDPLDTLWRRLQDPGGCQREPLKALSAAIHNFLSPQSKTLTMSCNDDTSQLWFTHDDVRPCFSHGHLKGQTVESYVDELVQQLQDLTDEDIVPGIHLHVVFHHGRFKSFGNRRTWALREASRKLGRSLKVATTVHPLVPGEEFMDGASAVKVLKKFEVSHTSKTNGNQPPLRVDRPLPAQNQDASTPPEETVAEPSWLCKYRSAKGADDKLLRTSTLPILDKLSAVAANIVEGKERIFLMSGSTGCGKSTQVPQAVYDFVRNRDGQGRGPSIVCTQPRRVAACSLDEGVSADRLFREVWPEELGKRIVAHQIGGETNKGSDTRLLYCTAGVLLQMLRNAGHQGVRQFHYVFLDEVHERSMDDDLLIGFLCSRRFLDNTNMKVIVMSATLTISTFLGYLELRFGRNSHTVGIICLDRADHLDKLSSPELHWLSESAGVDLSDYGEDQCVEDLVQVMVQAQVVRPHPMRLQYLDDLLHPIVMREGFEATLAENGLRLRPAGFLEPQLFEVANEAWEAMFTYPMFENWEPLSVMLSILEDGAWVISEARELFAKLFCCKLMQHRIRNCSFPVVNAEELGLLREALPSDGPPVLGIERSLAGGLIPKGSLITSYCHISDSLEYQPRIVKTRNDLPQEYASRMIVSFASLVPATAIEQSLKTNKHSDDDELPYVALMFLPGLSMISDFQFALQDVGELRADEVRTLHSKVKQEQQAEAVQPIQRGRRAILANNIAESSITVPNADIVVDLCLQRTMRWNEDRQGQLLDLTLATKDSLNQRAGRAARTKAGMVVRLITREEFDLLPDSRDPEMLRRPVDKVLLKIINMAPAGSKNGIDAKTEIRSCISPPEDDKIEEALIDLQNVNAVQLVRNSLCHFKALQMGVLLDDLPLDIDIGLIVAWGVQLGLEDVAVDAAAMLHAYNVVGEPRATFQDGGKPFIDHCACLRVFANGFPSDVVMLTNLLRSFRQQARLVDWVEGTQDGVAIQKMQLWCLQNSANYQSFVSLSSTVLEIHKQLRALLPLANANTSIVLEEKWLSDEESASLMFLFCGSLHRNMQQMRNGAQPVVGLGVDCDDRAEWGNQDIIISYDNSKSKKHTHRCITSFFNHGHCGIYGYEVDVGSTGSKGGWLRIRLDISSDSEQLVFGYPRAVTDVLKLSRDFNKLCGDGDTIMNMAHKASTRAVPIFWRWESLTEKHNNIVLQTSSVANPYLEIERMRADEIESTICARKFESFHVKTQNRWQKAEGLTLLPCFSNDSKTAHDDFPKLIFAIFAHKSLKPVGVPSLRLELVENSSGQDIRTLLTSHECVLQKFGDESVLEWSKQTRNLRSLLCKLFQAYGGPLSFKALDRPKIPEERPNEDCDSDLSDSQLVDSEPESPLLSRSYTGAPGSSPSVTQVGTSLLLINFDYWWLLGGRYCGETQGSAECLEDCVKQVEKELGNMTDIFVYGSSLHASLGAVSVQKCETENKLRAALGQVETEIHERSHFEGKVVQIKEVASVHVAISTHALQSTQCLRQVEPAVWSQMVVFFDEPACIAPLLPIMNRQQDVQVRIATFTQRNRLPIAIPQKVVTVIPPRTPQKHSSQPTPSTNAGLAHESSPSSAQGGFAGVPHGKRKGLVDKFIPQKGFGFIIGDKACNGAFVFLPMKNCIGDYIPCQGDTVFYKLGKQPDGKPVANYVEKAS